MLTLVRKPVAALAVAAAILAGGAAGVGTSTLMQLREGDPGNYGPHALQLTNEFLGTRPGASPAQVTQYAGEHSVALQAMIVRQNDEIIKLLRQLAAK
jgi:hypothetical protein